MKPIKVMIMGEPGIIEVPVALQSGERTRMEFGGSQKCPVNIFADEWAGLQRHGWLSLGGLES